MTAEGKKQLRKPSTRKSHFQVENCTFREGARVELLQDQESRMGLRTKIPAHLDHQKFLLSAAMIILNM